MRILHAETTARRHFIARPALLRISIVLIVLMTCVLLIALIAPQPNPEMEGKDYYAIAAGDYSAANYYYARRVLHPLTAGFIARNTGSSLPTSFHVISILSLTVYLGAITIYLASATNMAFALMVMPLLLKSSAYCGLPRDLFPHTLFLGAGRSIFSHPAVQLLGKSATTRAVVLHPRVGNSLGCSDCGHRNDRVKTHRRDRSSSSWACQP